LEGPPNQRVGPKKGLEEISLPLLKFLKLKGFLPKGKKERNWPWEEEFGKEKELKLRVPIKVPS